MIGSLFVEASPVVQFPIGLLGGILATLVMDRVMAVVPEGTTPPFIAAGVLTECHPDESPERLAAVVHNLAGAGTGLLFVWLSLAIEALAGGPSILTVAGTTVVLYLLMVGFFAAVPLPRANGVGRSRRGTILRAWAIAAAAYLVVLVPVVTLLTAVV